MLWFLACVVLAIPAAVLGGERAFPGRNGSIVFASQRVDGGWELYSVGARGGAARQLTAHSPEAFGAPAWSPDGHTIAFLRGSDLAVFLADAATGRLRQSTLVAGAFLDGVSWAPDGRRLVYSATDAHGRTDLWTADAAGTNRRRLTSGGEDSSPAWSPDGTTIAFARGSSTPRIYVIGSDGTHLRLVAPGSHPVWSPDSSMIAFSNDFGSVYVAGLLGGGARSLGKGESPAWSPDSRRLAIVAFGPDRSQLVVTAADGSSRRTLSNGCTDESVTWSPATTITSVAVCDNGGTAAPGLQAVDPDSGDRSWLIQGYSSRPSWSPNAGRLAFFMGSGILEVANADGSGAHELLAPPVGGERHPAWSPDGRHLAAEADRPNPLPGAPALIASPVNLPAWSPDGTQLVGNRGDAAQDVLIANLKTGALRQIYHDDGAGQPTLSDAAWSPDGRWIEFGTENGLVRYDVKRGRFLTVASTQLIGGHPTWSPDGKRLAFDVGDCYSPARSCSIVVAGADGAHPRRIAADASEPTWSPDGHQIAFVRVLARRNSEIYAMHADGTHQRRLTVNGGPDVDPDWQRVH